MEVKRNWRPFLANPETRLSHIGLLVVTVLLLSLSIIVLSWTLIRVNQAGGESINDPGTRNKNAMVRWKQRQGRAIGTATFTVIDTKLVDPFHSGYHWIGPNQSIMSNDGRFEFGLTTDGEAVFYDHAHSDSTPYWTSHTANATSPGTRFVLGSNGICYILKEDGSRVYSNDTSSTVCCIPPSYGTTCNNNAGPPCFWESPNQLQPYFRCPDGSTFYVSQPFVLTFYDNGMYLYSDDSFNITKYQLSSSLIPIWWIDVTGGSPPGADAFPLENPSLPFPADQPTFCKSQPS